MLQYLTALGYHYRNLLGKAENCFGHLDSCKVTYQLIIITLLLIYTHYGPGSSTRELYLNQMTYRK